jgi:hypothetical protein
MKRSHFGTRFTKERPSGFFALWYRVPWNSSVTSFIKTGSFWAGAFSYVYIRSSLLHPANRPTIHENEKELERIVLIHFCFELPTPLLTETHPTFFNNEMPCSCTSTMWKNFHWTKGRRAWLPRAGILGLMRICWGQDLPVQAPACSLLKLLLYFLVGETSLSFVLLCYPKKRAYSALHVMIDIAFYLSTDVFTR